MSTTDSKFEQHRDTEGPARRTYASLEATRGFRNDPGCIEEGHHQVTIAPMGGRTYWRHVGSGRWNAKDALYEEVTP